MNDKLKGDLTMECPECLTSGRSNVGQSFAPGELVWFQSLSCSRCDQQVEVDGNGLPPEAFRNAIIKKCGQWGLWIDVSGTPKVEVCKIFRRLLSIKMEETVSLKERIPGIVYTGTDVEMRWLSSIIEQAAPNNKAVKIDSETTLLETSLHLFLSEE